MSMKMLYLLSISTRHIKLLLLLSSKDLLIFHGIGDHDVRGCQSTKRVHDVLVFKLDLLRLFCLAILQISRGGDAWELVMFLSIVQTPASFFDPIVFVVIALKDK